MRLCRLFVFAFLVAYLLALALLAVGHFGLFGQEKDPLSAVFVILLGQPWIQLVDYLPESLRMGAAVLSPVLTICLLFALCRWIGRRAE